LDSTDYIDKLIPGNVPRGQHRFVSGFVANPMLCLRHLRIVTGNYVLYLYWLLGGVAFKAIGTDFLLSEAHAGKQ
jgi:hypothetical protein